MLRALKIEPEKCTGCLQCELACSLENEGILNPAKSRIKVFTFHHEGRFSPYTRTQCEEAWCMHARLMPLQLMLTPVLKKSLMMYVWAAKSARYRVHLAP